MKELKIKKMLAKEQLFVPCVYDCLSAKAAEKAGFKALMLSGGALAYSVNGLPDMAFSTPDELIWTVERITNCTDLPVLVDADDGYGESPIVVYNTVKRLIKAGASGMTIDDSTGIRGFERKIAAASSPDAKPYYHKVVSRKVWLSKIKATVEACKGTGALVIARTECAEEHGFNEAIERCVRARELGADMTLIVGGLKGIEEAKKVAEYDSGWKMWPDVFSVNGVPNVELKDVEKLGFNLVTFHIFEKAALYGMMLYGSKNIENGNTVFSETFDMNGLITQEELYEAISMDRKKWLTKLDGFCK